jgi:hypothetical protein
MYDGSLDWYELCDRAFHRMQDKGLIPPNWKIHGNFVEVT